MKFPRRVFNWKAGFLALAICLAGCKPTLPARIKEMISAAMPSATPAKPRVAPSQPPKPKPPLQLRYAAHSDREPAAAIAQLQLNRLIDGKFDDLEQEVTKLTTDNSTLPSGTPTRKAFYDSFYCDDGESSPKWLAYEAQLNAWLKAYPDSEAARLATARFYISYAWLARGSGYADTVTKEGWRLFDERLKRALACLLAVKSPAMRNESYWSSLLTLALGLGGKKDQFLVMVKEPLKDPRYRRYVLAHTCVFLLPRWHGQPGEWQAWLAEQTKNDPDNQDYAFAVAHVLGMVGPTSGPPYGPGAADWGRVKDGLQARAKRFPQSRWIGSQIIFNALLANDQDTFIQTATEMDGEVEPDVFPSQFLDKLNKTLAAGQL